MNNENIKKVVIVGGGAAGWMAASVLARAMGSLLEIQLIESDDIGTVGVGEATIPQIKLLNNLLGIDESDFLRNTQGTIKLGIQFNDWGQLGDSYIHAFGGMGLDLGMLPFYQYWLRSRPLGQHTSLWDYSLNATAAFANKFAPVEKVGDTRLAGLIYAYHFDASLFARYLRHYSEKLGVVRTEGKIIDTTLRDSDNFIESVTLDSGEKIFGELFIDCSGFRGLLIEQALKTGYEDWSHWLPCNRAVAVPCEPSEPLLPYTQATAREAGWQWRIPLQHRTGNGHVYSSRYMSDDEATSILMNNLDGNALAEPRLLKFVTGRRKKFWNKNCVALGLASGFMEPLESTSIHLVQLGLSKLITMFPDKRFEPADVDEYNRHMVLAFEQIRDFLILHYYATGRTDTRFWRDCREMNVPTGLLRKLTLFKANGRIYREADELFSELGWLQVMLGQGVESQGYHPMADMLTPGQLDEFLANIRTIIDKAVAKLPLHSEFIARQCAAAKA